MDRQQLKIGTVYCCRNIMNGMCYIGKTSRFLNDRIKQHITQSKTNRRTYIEEEIERVGSNNFEWIVVESNIRLKDLTQVERKYINDFESMYPNGYNKR